MLDRFRLTYRIEIRDGWPVTIQGRAPQRFVAAIADIARMHDIRRGRIECKGQGRHARLRFSQDFPERGRQAIRNAWTPPTAPGPGGGNRAQG